MADLVVDRAVLKIEIRTGALTAEQAASIARAVFRHTSQRELLFQELKFQARSVTVEIATPLDVATMLIKALGEQIEALVREAIRVAS